MNSQGNDSEAALATAQGLLAERVYTSRLLGLDHTFGLHGGGNTSVKIREHEVFGEQRVREIYGDSVVVIPYVMPGFDLARVAADRFSDQAGPNTVGMVLLKHGFFSFGKTARVAYERMIDLASRAEEYLAERHAWT